MYKKVNKFVNSQQMCSLLCQAAENIMSTGLQFRAKRKGFVSRAPFWRKKFILAGHQNLCYTFQGKLACPLAQNCSLLTKQKSINQ